MRKTIASIVLVVLFLVLLQAGAEFFFSKANRLENDYRWKSAQHFYEMACKLNPLCDKYQTALGKLVMKQGKYKKNKDEWYEYAEEIFLRAVKINSFHAFNWYELGMVYIRKALNTDEKDIRDRYIFQATECFNKAVKLDPFNLRINYSIGCDMLTVWVYLKRGEKDFVLNRFRAVLDADQGYFKNIYPIFMYYTHDFKGIQKMAPDNLEGHENVYKFLESGNLWSFRSSQEDIINKYLEEEDPQAFEHEQQKAAEILKDLLDQNKDNVRGEWIGQSADGRNKIENGQMYWNGTISRIINIPSGVSSLTIQAKGTKAEGVSPYMIVKLDSEVIGEMFVENVDWKKFNIDLSGKKTGEKVLSVIFVNDGRSLDGDEDRNLFVGEVKIN